MNPVRSLEIFNKLAQIGATLLQHDDALRIIWQELQPHIQWSADFSPQPISQSRHLR